MWGYEQCLALEEKMSFKVSTQYEERKKLRAGP